MFEQFWKYNIPFCRETNRSTERILSKTAAIRECRERLETIVGQTVNNEFLRQYNENVIADVRTKLAPIVDRLHETDEQCKVLVQCVETVRSNNKLIPIDTVAIAALQRQLLRYAPAHLHTSIQSILLRGDRIQLAPLWRIFQYALERYALPMMRPLYHVDMLEWRQQATKTAGLLADSNSLLLKISGMEQAFQDYLTVARTVYDVVDSAVVGSPSLVAATRKEIISTPFTITTGSNNETFRQINLLSLVTTVSNADHSRMVTNNFDRCPPRPPPATIKAAKKSHETLMTCCDMENRKNNVSFSPHRAHHMFNKLQKPKQVLGAANFGSPAAASISMHYVPVNRSSPLTTKSTSTIVVRRRNDSSPSGHMMVNNSNWTVMAAAAAASSNLPPLKSELNEVIFKVVTDFYSSLN